MLVERDQPLWRLDSMSIPSSRGAPYTHETQAVGAGRRWRLALHLYAALDVPQLVSFNAIFNAMERNGNLPLDALRFLSSSLNLFLFWIPTKAAQRFPHTSLCERWSGLAASPVALYALF